MVSDIAVIALAGGSGGPGGAGIPNTPAGRLTFAVRFIARLWQFISEVMLLPIGIGNLTLWHIILYLWILYMIGILIIHLVGPGGA